MAKRPQSGDIDMAFVRIFMHSSARAVLRPFYSGQGESLRAEPPARPRAEPDEAREAAAREAPGMRQKRQEAGSR